MSHPEVGHSNSATNDGGLPKLTAALTRILRELNVAETLSIRPGRVLGRLEAAGNAGPLLSSAAQLVAGDQGWWIPWPIVATTNQAGSSRAPIFVIGGRSYLFPTIRACVEGGTTNRWEYFSLDDWLYAAIHEWHFPLQLSAEQPASNVRVDGQDLSRWQQHTVVNRLQFLSDRLTCRDFLKVFGHVIRFAVLGRAKSDRFLGIASKTNLKFPNRGSWLRPLVENENGTTGNLNREPWANHSEDSWTSFSAWSARSLVITARLVRPSSSDVSSNGEIVKLEKILRSGDGVPRVVEKGERYRYAHGTGNDSVAIDPYHTPEGQGIRLRLHAALGATLVSRQLHPAPASHEQMSRSTSTAQIPFAGYNDPRRLLLAAKAQEQAVPLRGAVQPLVVTEQRSPTIGDPAGVNLRVGYLAWAGWNHEDAWVISESAAQKLVCVDRWTQTIAIGSLESELIPHHCKGDQVKAGALLVQRRFAPAFLWPSLQKLKAFLTPRNSQTGSWDHLTLTAEPGDVARHDGKIEQVQLWDLFREQQGNFDHGFEQWLENAECIATDLRIAPKIRRDYRAILRFTMVRYRPLQVGDKLANRHGHKGVVGLILPDERMPFWDGKPLEALIDPISVLNRGNWGQLYETIAGAVSAKQGGDGRTIGCGQSTAKLMAEFRSAYPQSDEHGRSVVTAPETSPWYREANSRREFRAVAGHQFVMRMPQHAVDRITADYQQPVARGLSTNTAKPSGHVRKTAARIDVLSRYAMWAHGIDDARQRPGATNALKHFRTLLWLGGAVIDHGEANGGVAAEPSLTVRRLDLGNLATVPSGAKEVRLTKGKRGIGIGKQLSDPKIVPKRRLCFWRLPKAVLANIEPTTAKLPWKTIRWLPIVNTDDLRADPHARAGNRSNGSKQMAHNRRLPRLLEALCNAACSPLDPQKPSRLIQIFNLVVGEAFRVAVGATSKDAKHSWFQKHVHCYRRKRSGRAVIAPSGLPSENDGTPSDSLGIDEIALPKVLFDAVSTGHQSEVGSPAISVGSKPLVWIKRDPVLHRWGFLPVRYHQHAHSSIIQLPASLLGALGGDYDGDEATVFAVQESEHVQAQRLTPSRLITHQFTSEPMFKPGKQYVYGLHLLSHDPQNVRLLKEFNNELRKLRAPTWDLNANGSSTTQSAEEALKRWCMVDDKSGDLIEANPLAALIESAEQSQTSFRWAVLEKYALLALAADPGMGIGVQFDATEILQLDVVRCGAARYSLAAENSKQGTMMVAISAGKSLELIDAGIDPIETIMAAAQSLKGTFGNELRHIVHKAQHVSAENVTAAQTLTEKLTQAVLSTKSVDKDLPKFAEYKQYLRPSWLAVAKQANNSNLPEWIDALKNLLDPSGVPQMLGEMGQEPGNENVQQRLWRQWLFAPHILLELLHPLDRDQSRQFVTIEIPTDDLRTSIFYPER